MLESLLTHTHSDISRLFKFTYYEIQIYWDITNIIEKK